MELSELFVENESDQGQQFELVGRTLEAEAEVRPLASQGP